MHVLAISRSYIIMYRLMRAIFCLSLLNAAAAFTPSQVRSPRRHAV